MQHTTALLILLLIILIYLSYETFTTGSTSYVRLYNLDNMWAEYTPRNLPDKYLRTKQSGDITRIEIDLTPHPGIVEIWAFKPGSNVATEKTSPQKTTVYDYYSNPVRKSNYKNDQTAGEKSILDCNHEIMYHPDWVPIVRAGPGFKGAINLLIPVHESFIYIDYL